MALYGYDPQIKRQIIQRMMIGIDTITKIHMETGVSESTLRKWRREVRNSDMGVPDIDIEQSIGTNTEIIGKRIAVVPDMQVKPGIDLSYCTRIGRYLADKRPHIIIVGGDFGDMPSLNMYDAPGSRGMEGQRYKEDILSVQTAMRLLMTPIKDAMQTGWDPRLILTLGNHEDRINRAIKATPKLDGVIGLSDLHYEEHGWEVIPFLEPIVVEGIAFAHYFCSGIMGRPITTARALLNKKHMSCFAFHQQGRDIAFGQRGDGRQMIGIIAGSCYEHDEHYLNPQTNNHWRGLYILNDVIDGAFEENAVSLKYLRRKYE